MQLLDPEGTGHIDYFGFVNGMSQLMSGNSDSYIEGHSLISRSRGSTFMEGEASVLQSDNNNSASHKMLEEEIFENTNTNSSDKTSSNEYDAESIHEEGTDYFGLDTSLVQNHHKSLSVRKSISMGGLVRNSKRLSMHTLNDDSAFNNQSYDEDNNRVSGDNNSDRYEQLIEELEFKVKNLEVHNLALKHEIDEEIEKNKFHAAENSSLVVK